MGTSERRSLRSKEAGDGDQATLDTEVPPSTRNQRRSLLKSIDKDEDTPVERNQRPSRLSRETSRPFPADNALVDSGDEDEHDEDDEEEEEDAVPLGDQPRYSRRNRAVVERYAPELPAANGGSRRIQSHVLAELDNDSDGGRHISQPGENFTQRYSARERRVVERFVPGQEDGPGSGPGSGGRAGRGSGDRDARAAKRSRHDDGVYAPSHGGMSSSESDGDDHDDDDMDDLELEDDLARGQRKTYSFRDRSLVTIQPAKRQQLNQEITGSGPRDREREKYDRSRRIKGSRRGGGGRARGFDELPDLPLVNPNGLSLGPGTSLGPAGQPWIAGGGGGIMGGGFGIGPDATNAPHNSAAIAGGGAGAGGSGANASLEITPLEIDTSVSFDQVGGLEHYVRALKEMVFLPLVYPELFERFHVSPPRGVLFYGPPGTGKTLVARALAAHASRAAGGRRVSFFMRKGADVLSKWVGESERQLRLLFEEARRRQPSIIFFDEIDGLAPVRSSRSDQIHNSIVSTLLALMDGLDKRGQVVVIGATNRVDALDGALRRPGRFDRELLFPLPNQAARAEILGIHTRQWEAPPSAPLLDELAASCVGYCGADLKALVTEASLAALRRRYPQIYDSEHKLLVDPKEVRVDAQDFVSALQSITPASHRAAASPARPLPGLVAPVLLPHLQAATSQLQRIFPQAAAAMRAAASDAPAPGGAATAAAFGWSSAAALTVQRPRLLIAGPAGSGQAHLGPALLYALEGLPAHAIGLPSLLTDPGARSPEEALVHAVAEARRAAPAVIYLPHLDVWWETAPASLRATLWTLLADLPPELPLLLLATSDVEASQLHPEARSIFGGGEGFYTLPLPTHSQRLEFFTPVATLLVAPPNETDAAQRTAAPLPALPIAPEGLAAEEAARKEAERAAARQRYEDDQASLRALRMALRSVVSRLLQDRKYRDFWEPVSPDEDPYFWQVVKHPMDLSTLLDRVDRRRYNTPAQFLADVALIPEGERQYLGDRNPSAEDMRHIGRACALEDEARGLVEATVRPDLISRLEKMVAKGGPAPAPKGLNKEMGLAADGTVAQPARAAVREDHPVGDGGAGRRTSRLAGGEVDGRIVHGDPEAELRRLRAMKKREQELMKQQDFEDASLQPAAVAVEEDVGTAAAVAEGEETTHAAHTVGENSEPFAVLAASTKDNLPGEGTTTDGRVLSRKDAAATAGRREVSFDKAQVGEGSEEREEVEDVQGRGQLQEEGVLALGGAPARQLTAAERSLVESVQKDLTDRTASLCLEGLEDIHACAARLAWSRRKDTDRHAVVEAALRDVDEYLRRLSAA